MMTENEDKIYKLTIEARNFHYENFSKWMTFYYVAVAAVFVAFYNYKTDDKAYLLIALLGCFISILWHLACKGYYYWIKNWTHLINRIEQNKKVNERVYSIFAKYVKENDDNLFNPIQSANISTSKVTLILSFGICCFWFFILIDKLIEKYCIISLCCCLVFVFAVFLATISVVLLGQILKSDISKHKFVVNEIDN